MERDRRRLPHCSRHILRRQREDEGHGVVGTGAVGEAQVAAYVALVADQFGISQTPGAICSSRRRNPGRRRASQKTALEGARLCRASGSYSPLWRRLLPASPSSRRRILCPNESSFALMVRMSVPIKA